MSETAGDTLKRNEWLLGGVIRATARATVTAFFERLRTEGWAKPPEASRGCPVPADCNGTSSSLDCEVKHLLRMYDELVKLQDHFEARAGTSKRQRRRLRHELGLISSLITRILDRLRALGVQLMGFPETVDYQRHEPVQANPTHILADDGRVTDVYIHGFTSNGRVVRQAKVAVLKYVPTPEHQPRKEN